MPRLHPAVLAVLALFAFAALPAAASGADAAPRWNMALRSFPTTLVPGSAPDAGVDATNAIPQYSAVITNAGAGTASGPISVTATLPPGIVLAPGVEAVIKASGHEEGECGSPSPEEVTCEIEPSVPSGGFLLVAIPLAISESAPTPAVTQLTVSGGGAPAVSRTLSSAVGGPPPPFGFLESSHGAGGITADAGGLDANLAGSHPYSVLLEDNFAAQQILNQPRPVEDLRDLELQLPRGLAINPQAMDVHCGEAELGIQKSSESCPLASQVGQISIETVLGGIEPGTFPLYDIQPPRGVAAEFGFNVLGTLIHIQGGLDGSFHLTGGSSEILAKYTVLGIQVELWGDPSDPAHDGYRRGHGCLASSCPVPPAEANEVPFVTMPTSCGEPLTLGATAVSWQGTTATRATTFSDVEGGALEMEGCNALAFEPTIESKATTNAAESPSGLDFKIHQPQNEAIEGRATAALKDARVTLPEGMVVNPAGANGLGACSEEQIGYAPVEGKIQFETSPASCPNAAKIGTVEVTTPLLDHPLPGAVYVAKPFANPFGSLLALYLAIEDEESGIVAKLAGKVEPDPQTGRLTAAFAENPELPVNDIALHMFNGANAPLQTPITCGTKTTTTTLTPWSTPEGADAHPSDSFQTSVGCSPSEAAAPTDFSFSAGTVSPLSASYSPFVLRLARKDGTQHLTGIEMTLPEGLVGKLAGIPYCPEPAIALAQSREAPEKGKEEISSPACPATSEVGTVQVTAGSGISPIPVSGHAYLAGPYKGAPLSMVVIVPAVAGPFDLGTVVDRVALHVGEYDARIHAVADPLPTIRDGIPLDVRTIALKLDRSGFMLNPSSCEAMAIEGSVSTQTGQSAPLKNRFQVGECGRLGFKPKLKISLKGRTTRSGHPALKAVVTMPQGGANLASIQVALPHSEFLDQGNLDQVCTQGDLKAATCPTRAIYGHVKVWTPLLDQPLEGPVYLGVGFGYELPALVAELNGQLRLLSKGKVDTDKQDGLRNTFEAVPDAPVGRIVLEMKGGPKYGLLENSENICRKTQRAIANFTAANGKVVHLRPKIANSCKRKHRKHRKHRGHKRKRGRQ
ncbi:MAG TPA: hypothetical protein VFK14_12715 [Solirubrobacterales bacterium]|nr:hypothetical protein [Solirubrobacterales bacterium]